MAKPRQDLAGQKFNHLTALHHVEGPKWMFRCDCGNDAVLWSSAVKSGHTKSCGCLRTNKGLGAARVRDDDYGFWNSLKWKHRSIASWAKHYNTTPAEIMQRLKRDKTL
jgi:hypothetical protein